MIKTNDSLANSQAGVNNTRQYWYYFDILMIRLHQVKKYPNSLWNTDTFIQLMPNYMIISANIVKYGYPTILAFGTVSNLLSLFLTLKTYKLYDICIYYAVLSVSDALTIWINLFPLIHLLNVDSIGSLATNTAQCRLLKFAKYFTRTLSGWLIVAATFSRFVVLYFPFYYKTKTSKYHVKFLSISIICVFVLCTPNLIVYDHLDMGVPDFISLCFMVPRGFITYDLFIYWNALLFPVLPVVLVFILNFSIIYKIWSSNQFKSRHSNRKESSTQVITTLLVVSSLFLVFSLPSVWNSLRQLYFHQTSETMLSARNQGEGAIHNWESYSTDCALFLNNCVNFYIYILTGKSLREKFIQSFKNYFNI